MNGIGERAGNCALKKYHGDKVRKDIMNVIIPTSITTKFRRTSQTVSQICNMPILANKSDCVGSGAFRPLSGIHRDGNLKNREN